MNRLANELIGLSVWWIERLWFPRSYSHQCDEVIS